MGPASSRCWDLLSALELLYVVGPVALVAGTVLWMHLWRAVLFVAPASLRVSSLQPQGSSPPPELLDFARALLGLGLRPLGLRTEAPVFGRAAPSWDFVDAAGTTFGSLYLGPGRRPRLYFLSRVLRGEQPALVLTASTPRPGARATAAYQPGWFATFPPERLYAAHCRRLLDTRPRPADGAPGGRDDAAARLAAAREWLAGPAAPELRTQTLHGLLWSAFAVFMFAAILWARWA